VQSLDFANQIGVRLTVKVVEIRVACVRENVARIIDLKQDSAVRDCSEVRVFFFIVQIKINYRQNIHATLSQPTRRVSTIITTPAMVFILHDFDKLTRISDFAVDVL
jgi:hypothetical protein